MDNMPWIPLFNTFVPKYLIAIVLFYLFFLFKIFIQCILIIFPLPQLPPGPPHLYPLNFLFFLSVDFKFLYKEFNLIRKKKKTNLLGPATLSGPGWLSLDFPESKHAAKIESAVLCRGPRPHCDFGSTPLARLCHRLSKRTLARSLPASSSKMSW